MPYIPLHHKYRPQTFADLVGQEAIARTLTNAISQNQIAPAYLFTGARGTGKTSSARIMAKALNCQSTPTSTPTPCGQCEMCRTIARGIALDVTEIDAASNTGVDNIRELIERAQFAPAIARYKVYIIDECHMLSSSAFNALLKTLEEPPDRVIFILATTDPQRVLPTIISRCQRYDFRRIPLGAMVEHLGAIAQKENINITAPALLLVAQIAQGGLRDAESLLDQLSLLTGEITPDAVWDLVGTVPERDLLELLTYISQGDGVSLLTNLRRILDRGREPLILLQNLGAIYRDLLIAKMTTDKGDLIALSEQGWQKLQILVPSFTSAQIITGQQLLRNAEVQIKNTTQPRLWLEITLFELMSSLQQQQTKPHASIMQQTESSTKPSPPQALAPTILTAKKYDEPITLWQEILNKLSAPTKALLVNNLNAMIVELRDQEILIGISDSKDEIKKKEKSEIAKQRRPEIEIVVQNILGKKMQIRYKFIAEAESKSELKPEPKPKSNSVALKAESPKPFNPVEPTIKPSTPTNLTPPKSHYGNTAEDVAVRNLVDLFGGQVISLEETNSES